MKITIHLFLHIYLPILGEVRSQRRGHVNVKELGFLVAEVRGVEVGRLGSLLSCTHVYLTADKLNLMGSCWISMATLSLWKSPVTEARYWNRCLAYWCSEGQRTVGLEIFLSLA